MVAWSLDDGPPDGDAISDHVRSHVTGRSREAEEAYEEPYEAQPEMPPAVLRLRMSQAVAPHQSQKSREATGLPSRSRSKSDLDGSPHSPLAAAARPAHSESDWAAKLSNASLPSTDKVSGNAHSGPRVILSECADSSILQSSSKCGEACSSDGEGDGVGEAEKRAGDTQSNNSATKLEFKTKVLLGIGESVQGIYVVISGYYLNTFLLETACIDPMYVGLIQAIQGAFDAVNDPVIGFMSDRTRTRWGRRRPWLLFAAPFLALAYFALWNSLPREVPQFWKFVYALFVHMCVSIGITSIQVQIGALVPELTDDYDERTSVSAFRLFIGNFVGFACAICHNQVMNRGSNHDINKSNRYRISGAMFSTVICASSWITFAGIKERFEPRQETRKRMTLVFQFKAVLRNRAFLCVMGAYLCGPTAVALIQGNIFMFCKYVLKDESTIELIIPAVQGTALISMPIWVIMSRRLGKKIIYIMGGSVLVCCFGSIYWIEDVYVAVCVSTVIGFCGPVAYLVPYSMLPDVIEEDELRTGKRREGLFVGFFTIVLKFSVTSALTITNFILKAGGYRAPKASCDAEIDELMQDTQGLPDEQPEMVVSIFRILCGPLPMSFFLLGMVFVWLFPISRSKQLAMAKLAAQARLERRTAQSETSSVTSTHSPRDVKELVDFIDGPPDATRYLEQGDKVLEAMNKELCEAKYLEYAAQSRQVLVTFEGDEQPHEARGGDAVDKGLAEDILRAVSAPSNNASTTTVATTLTGDGINIRADDGRTTTTGQSESTRVPSDRSPGPPTTLGRMEGNRVLELQGLIEEKKREKQILDAEIRILEESVVKTVAKRAKREQREATTPMSSASSRCVFEL